MNNRDTINIYDKVYCVILDRGIANEPFETEHTFLSYSEALLKYKEYNQDNYYHVQLVEKIILINTIREEYHKNIVNDYRPEE